MNKIEIHKNICDSLNDLYKKKNQDYGDSFGKSYKEYGLTMSCIRLEDKLNRLKSLNKNGNAQVKDESIQDTLMDLANYAIMTTVAIRIKSLPQEETKVDNSIITDTTEPEEGWKERIVNKPTLDKFTEHSPSSTVDLPIIPRRTTGGDF